MNKINPSAIPEELKMYRQWVVWKFEDRENSKPTKVPYNAITGKPASVAASNTWSSFTECVNALDNYDGVGFVLTEQDPYTVMDLDQTSTEDEQRRFTNYYERLNSWTEFSPSNKGCHIWVKGHVERGRNSRPFEIYTKSRFITVTGNVHYDTAIAHRQDEILAIWHELGEGKSKFLHYDGQDPEAGTDQVIVDRAASAKNGYKFCQLWAGHYQEFYASQSEADFALIDIIAFYTQNMDQIIRLFRFSELGKREKAQRDDYVALMAKKAFDKLPPKADLDELSADISALVDAYKQGTLTPQEQEHTRQQEIYDMKKPLTAAVSTATYGTDLTDWLSKSPSDIIDAPLPIPDGLLGQLATFMYDSAPRPVREVALTASLGLMAGICGSAYNISNSGLNLYIILLASTGTGKEGVSSGISKLMSRVEVTLPAASTFIGAAHIASPQALMKSLATTGRCCVSIIGEAGIWLKDLSSPTAAPHVMGLRRLLLELYGRSGKDAQLRQAIYADAAKNSDAIRQPAYSIIGESTQTKFMENITNDLIAEGFIPRWLLIEYKGGRPPMNYGHGSVLPPSYLVSAVTALAQHALNSMSAYAVTDVHAENDDVAASFDAFNQYCDHQINASMDEAIKNLWTRTYLKALRVAAIVAVGRNFMNPKVNAADWNFAVLVVLKDTLQFCRQLNSGYAALGQDNETYEQGKALKAAIRVMLVEYTADQLQKYGVSYAMKTRNVVPYSYLHKKLSRRREFVKSRRGATAAIKDAINNLELCGVLMVMPKQQAMTEFETTGVMYSIVNIRAILDNSMI